MPLRQPPLRDPPFRQRPDRGLPFHQRPFRGLPLRQRPPREPVLSIPPRRRRDVKSSCPRARLYQRQPRISSMCLRNEIRPQKKPVTEREAAPPHLFTASLTCLASFTGNWGLLSAMRQRRRSDCKRCPSEADDPSAPRIVFILRCREGWRSMNFRPPFSLNDPKRTGC